MSKSPVKLISVSPCANLDHFIKNFVTKNRQKSQTAYLLNFPSTQKKRNQSSTRFGHKTSLSDWRSLYGESRPRTQSLIMNFNAVHKVDVQYTRGKGEWGLQSKYGGIGKFKQSEPTSKTAFNFYRSPMQNEIEIIGNLTARIGEGNRNKSFRQRKTRKSSYITRREDNEKY